MNFAVEDWAIERIIPYARNARTIPDSAITKVASSIKEFGWQQPIVVDPEGVILAGHTRLLAAKKLAMTILPVKIASGLTPAQAKAFRLMDNRSHEEAGWDEKLLALELEELRTTFDFDMTLTGFSSRELLELMDTKAPGESILSLLSITIAEPKHRVLPGGVYRMGAHTLLCESVIEGWPCWIGHLKEGMLFCPFPGPFVALSEKAKETPLLLVQPDVYIAGHCLDRYAEIHGEESVTHG